MNQIEMPSHSENNMQGPTSGVRPVTIPAETQAKIEAILEV